LRAEGHTIDRSRKTPRVANYEQCLARPHAVAAKA
jgi:hypothetical protein